MNRTFGVLTLMMMVASAVAQTKPKIGELYERLIQPSETNTAAAEIAQIAKNDPAARDFLASKLPSLIRPMR